MFGLKFFAIVPEKTTYIVERLGKYHATLAPGFNLLVPFIDRLAYKLSLKEEAIPIEKQQAITKDNVTIHLDGTVFIRVFDPYLASYKIKEPKVAIKLLCQTILRSEIGKLKLDQLMQERSELNQALQKALNQTAEEWGLKSLGVEILQVDPPEEIKKSMQQQAEAERLKRSGIIISEGKQFSEINIATGAKVAAIKQAEGESEAIKVVSESEAKALDMIADILGESKATKVVDFILLQHYIKGYQFMIKSSNVVVVPKPTGGNEFMSLAAMMMFNNQNSQRQPQQQSIQAGQEQKSVSEQQPQQQMSQEQLENLVKNNVYYDDIRLYSDDEARRAK